MKKLFSYLLAGLILLNVMGYYTIFMGIKYQNSTQITQRLDNEDYDNSETITLKIPLSIPYYGNTEFERVNGEIEHNGEFYRLVKQRLQNDTLQIVCIKDTKSKHIKLALEQYVKTFTDHATESPSKTIPNFIKDYIPGTFAIESIAGWSQELHYFSKEQSIDSPFISHLSPPPEV